MCRTAELVPLQRSGPAGTRVAHRLRCNWDSFRFFADLISHKTSRIHENQDKIGLLGMGRSDQSCEYVHNPGRWGTEGAPKRQTSCMLHLHPPSPSQSSAAAPFHNLTRVNVGVFVKGRVVSLRPVNVQVKYIVGGLHGFSTSRRPGVLTKSAACVAPREHEDEASVKVYCELTFFAMN